MKIPLLQIHILKTKTLDEKINAAQLVLQRQEGRLISQLLTKNAELILMLQSKKFKKGNPL